MKAIVISGGGAYGAWGGGFIQGLNKKYDLAVGTSTGSLLAPLVVTGKYKKLKDAYTSVTQESIFDFNPMKKDGNISFLKVIWRMIKGKHTMGESNNLKKLIDKFITIEDYADIKNNNKEVAVCCANLNKNNVGYFSTNKCSFMDFKDWMWISANAPVYMTLVKKNEDYWCDGGIIDHTPIQYAIDSGADEIDVIIHKPIEIDSKVFSWKPKNIIQLFLRVTDFLLYNVYRDDLNVARLEAYHKDVKLNIYHMPEKFLPHFLVFDKDEMIRMWDRGLRDSKSIECKEVILKQSNQHK